MLAFLCVYWDYNGPAMSNIKAVWTTAYNKPNDFLIESSREAYKASVGYSKIARGLTQKGPKAAASPPKCELISIKI
jgi:hypothetical protein